MNRFLRILLLIIGTISIAFAIGFFIQAPWATAIWPLKASTLSYIFLSSILAASGVPILWIGLKGETRAQAGGALNLGLMSAGSAVLSMQLYLHDHTQSLLVFGLASVVLTLCNVWIYLYARRFPFRDKRPTPFLVRISFGIFAVLLAFTGGALVLKRPNIFPWPLSPETSVYYGWIFLGAMCYFIYGLVRPSWSNACGQLLGFLAYDLVLILPFLIHFQSVPPQLHLSLTIYTTVLILSGALAIYYLFIHPQTRFNFARDTKSSQAVTS
jgi:hypothetical protein